MLAKGLLARLPKAWTQAVRQSSHSHTTVIGENLPFQVDNRPKLTAMFVVFIASGFWLPFFVVKHHLTK